MNTPWGYSQSVDVIANGLVSVSTAGHGGFKLSAERWAELQREFPTFGDGYAGAGWLEEDCDATLAVILWPECFPPQSVYYGCEMATGYDYLAKHTKAFFETEKGKKALAIANRFALDHVDVWHRGSCWTERSGGWGVSLQRKGEKRTVCFREYPSKSFYTDEEVEVLQAV